MFLFVKTIHGNEGPFSHEYFFGLVYFFSVGLSDVSLCVITGVREVHGAPVS